MLRSEKRIIKKILTQFLLNRRWERQEWYYSSTGTTRPSSLTSSSSKEYLVSSKSLSRQRKLRKGVKELEFRGDSHLLEFVVR